MLNGNPPSDRGAGPETDLEHLIVAYVRARDTWFAMVPTGDDLTPLGTFFESFEAAASAVLYHPCLTLNDLHRKVSFVLDEADLYTMAREDEDENGDLLRTFLVSLIAFQPS